MDFKMMGSVTGYTKSMQLKAKWQDKKHKGDFRSESKKTDMERKNDAFKAYYKDQQDKIRDDEMLSKINSKVAAGAELSEAELKYLKVKNPTLYEQIKREKDEAEAYERDLKQCRTKDEVEQMKMNQVNSALSTIGSVKNNPNIPEGTKLAVAQGVMHKLDKINRITEEFVKSGEYKKLPTEEELREAEKKLAEAEEEKRIQKPEAVTEAEAEAAAEEIERTGKTGEEPAETQNNTVAFNADKRERQLSAAKTSDQVSSVLTQLDKDLSDCKEGLKNGRCDEKEVAKVEQMIQRANEKKGQVANVKADPWDELEFQISGMM